MCNQKIIGMFDRAASTSLARQAGELHLTYSLYLTNKFAEKLS
jgi:hypothetical protein